jgi:protein-S-isoprenylcysteine O-methyltransferase Ste14
MLIKQTSLNMSRKKCRINELLSMCNVALGLAGISVLLLYDLASLRLFPNRVFLAALGYGLHGFAILAAAAAEEQLQLPVEAKIFGWPLLLVGLGWLCYCLFFFKPLANTYRGKLALTAQDPYALTRHPGFLGHVMLLVGLFFVTGSACLLQGGFFWILANLVYIFIQDRWLFPHIFEDYPRYRKAVPFLFPTKLSFQRFWQTR